MVFNGIKQIYYRQKRLANFMKASEQLETVWRNDSVTKLSEGFYISKIDDAYVVNGFYPSMKNRFLNKPMYYFVKIMHMNYKEFLTEVIGATDPTKARPMSLRHQIFKMNNDPNNGIHGSGSDQDANFEILNLRI